MSYETWHEHGYGICTDDIGEVSVPQIKMLLQLAPTLEKEIDQCLSDNEMSDPTVDDYFKCMDSDESGPIAVLLKEVIKEAEGIECIACEDFNGKQFLLYPPVYPWLAVEVDFKMTEESLREMFAKYAKVLTDRYINAEYQSVGNGG